MKSRVRLYDVIYSFTGAVLFLTGKIIYETNRLENFSERKGSYILCGVAAWIIILAVLLLLEYLTEKLHFTCGNKKEYMISGKVFLGLMLITVVMYGICYLAYFPGIFAYDIRAEVEQVVGISPITNLHPLLHTLLWWGAVYLESLIGIHPAGIVIYCTAQMLVTIAVCGYMLCWLKRKHVHIGIVLLSWAYLTFMPTLQIFSIITTKDIYFSDMLILLTTMLYDITTKEEVSKRCLAGAVLAGVAACLLRNNMICAVVFGILVCIVTKAGKKPLYVLCGIVVGSFFMTNVLSAVLGAESNMPRESLSVPMQQMSNVFVNAPETFSEEEMDLFVEYVPWAGNYNPRYADVVKSGFEDENYRERTKAFWKLWYDIGKRVPMYYVNAFLTLNVPLWYPGAELVDPYANREYIESKMLEKDEYKVEWMGVFPKIHEFYESVTESRNPGMNLFFLKPLFSLSFPFVTMYLGGYFIGRDKRKEYAWLYMIYVGVFLTYLLGAVSIFRYMYPFYVAAPLLWLPITHRKILNESERYLKDKI